jgi:hypothetical protein
MTPTTTTGNSFNQIAADDVRIGAELLTPDAVRDDGARSVA